MSTDRLPWVPAGVLAGLAGLAASHAAAMVLTFHDPPFTAVGHLIARSLPDRVVDQAGRMFGSNDWSVLLVIELLVLLAIFAVAGQLAREGRWRANVVWCALAAIGLLAIVLEHGRSLEHIVPVVAGLVAWIGVHSLVLRLLGRAVAEPVTLDHERRAFLVVAVGVVLASGAVALTGRVIGNARRHVEASRRLLRIDGVTKLRPPVGVALPLEGITPWLTPTDEFFTVDTTLTVPTIEPKDWRLRVHGMVERELELTFDALVSRPIAESWITLPCVTNEVGGTLVGNARWSGVRLEDLLAEAGVQPGADCVVQTSRDGWTCATPLSALTDGRDAMLAVAMNGRPLPIEHGFPVRTIVPGLYGHVSATKWVVDLEVTRFALADTYWTSRGWDEEAPVRLASRIDVPEPGSDLPSGHVATGGVAWAPGVGVARVEVSLDGRDWQRAGLAKVPSADTWVHWALTLDVPPGEHVLRVRAVDADGLVQTGVRREPEPSGATGWHEVAFTTTEE